MMLMMGRLSIASLVIGIILCAVPHSYGHDGEHAHCNTVYEKEGAPAVLSSPHCSHWKDLLNTYFMNHSIDCDIGVGTLREHEPLLKNQNLCNLNMWIPFSGINGLKYAKVGMVAIFDSNSPTDAAKLLNDYFIVHTFFLQNAPYMNKYLETLLAMEKYEFISANSELDQDDEVNQLGLQLERLGKWVQSYDGRKQRAILKEAFLRAIYDVKSSSPKKDSEARVTNPECIVTAILLVESKILVSSGCNARAIICTDKMWDPTTYEGISIDVSAQKLGKNPQVKADDPSSQLKSDIYLEKDATSDWQTLSGDHVRLVVASQGIFNKFVEHDVCLIAGGRRIKTYESYIPSCHAMCRPPLSQANCLLDKTYSELESESEGNHDNGGDLSAIVVPLTSTGFVRPKKGEDLSEDVIAILSAISDYCERRREKEESTYFE